MQFSFRGRDATGELKQGALEAPNLDAAANELIRRGITPIQIDEQASGGGEGALQWLQSLPIFRKKVDLDELIIFTRQMYALSKAGIPIIRSIRGLGETARSRELAVILNDIADRLEAGTTLAGAMQNHGDVFSDLALAMVHVGENTGQLDEAFLRLTSILELERETKRRIKQATRYPTFVLVALFVALMIINFFVIPRFAAVFSKLGADLPLATRILVGTSHFLINNWYFMFGVAVITTYGVSAWLKTIEGRLTWDRWKLKVPVIGPLMEKVALSRFARNLSHTLSAGMTVTHALSVVADAVDNTWIARHVREMRSSIERGDSLLRSAQHSQMFTPLILQMIAVGEETGAVDDMLVNAADFYDEEVDYDLKRLAESIEPLLIVAMGVLVLILALGVFLPMWDLGRAALGKG